MSPYVEPELAILVLDYCKPIESRLLLQSIKKHVKVSHKVIFCDNGSNENYSLQFLRDGLIDQLIINRESSGLGLGTRDLHAIAQSKYVLSAQNDQIFVEDLTPESFDIFKTILEYPDPVTIFDQTYNTGSIKSISIAGSPCGKNIYSERAFIMKTDFYKSLEPLSFGGAGKYHEYPWREGEIQQIYLRNGWIHLNPINMVADNGVFATRDMGDGGVWLHRTDSKELWVIVQPTQFNPSYPKLSDSEKSFVLNHGWIDGTILEVEKKDSFYCWQNTTLARMQDEYIADLRRRFIEKGR